MSGKRLHGICRNTIWHCSVYAHDVYADLPCLEGQCRQHVCWRHKHSKLFVLTLHAQLINAMSCMLHRAGMWGTRWSSAHTSKPGKACTVMTKLGITSLHMPQQNQQAAAGNCTCKAVHSDFDNSVYMKVCTVAQMR